MKLPNPQPLDLVLTTAMVDDFKRVKCQRYARCVDRASDMGWSQFHCNNCSVYDAAFESRTLLVQLTRAGRRLLRNKHDPEGDGDE